MHAKSVQVKKMKSLPDYNYNPLKFYITTILLTWILGFTSATMSYNADYVLPAFLLIIVGIFTPSLVSLVMLKRSGDPELMTDFRRRLFTIKGLSKPVTAFMFFLVLPLSFLAAVLLSIAFGGDESQLAMSASFISAMFIPLIASIMEEVGWRGYGVDSLRKTNNLFMTSIKHWIFWSLWHLPLFFINDFYHHNLWLEGPMLAVNYFLSILPLTIVFNWIYFNTNRSVMLAALFHLLVNASAEIFAIAEANKVWQTVSLGIFAIILVFREKDFFFNINADRTIQ